jgi:SIR2-like domain
VEEADWARLVAQLNRGDCTPFLGAGACDVLPTASELGSRWAAQYDYPFVDREDLAKVMQYAAIMEGDSVYLKEKVCDYLRSVDPPDYGNPAEPHALLAKFPIPVFITTNYDDFLVRALGLAGKSPNSAICSWFSAADYDRDLFEATPGLYPTPEVPLVYHLHGRMQNPRSLVLTESDYLEFLVRITTFRDDETLRLVPSAILSALTDNPLLFVGYSLQDWTFRVLFHGLLRSIPGTHRRRNVSVQLLPPVHKDESEVKERARRYLTRYLEDWRISIFWGSTAEFCHELRGRAGFS